jgi:3-hydroxy-3-methylglutaryl CoA synthase
MLIHLEIYKNTGKGKYTKGLGQLQLSFANASEDVNSISLTGNLILM